MRRHPEYTARILGRVDAFRAIAGPAAAHHERLDGSGYHLGLSADRLSPASRVLAVADVAEALSAERPYRAALPADEVLRIMRPEAGPKLDATAFAALEASLAHAHAPAVNAA
jgi:HD-GYP domain-containing protein (c-di-GMP phosphodiesterase class II)